MANVQEHVVVEENSKESRAISFKCAQARYFDLTTQLDALL